MLLDPGSSFLEKYSGCPDISFELDEGKDVVIEHQSGKGGADIIGVKNKAFEEPDTAMINQIGCEMPLSKGDGAMDFHYSLRNDVNKLRLKELNPQYILQGEKFSPSRICNIGEIIGSEEIDAVVSDHVYQGLFSMEGHHSESGHEFKALAGDVDGLKHDHSSQHKVLSNINFHSNFGFFGDVLQDSGQKIVHPQGYQHQIRSSGLDKFTAVDRNGKRSILHEVETQAQLMPSIPGVYFDRRQIGYRVRYHNSYVGWVALSRHSSIKDAYEYAKQLWLKARNKSNIGKCQEEQLEAGAPGGALGGRGMGVRKRVRHAVFDSNYQLNPKMLCKSGIGNEGAAYYDARQIGNEHIFHGKYYCSRNDDYGIHPMAESEYAFSDGAISKQSFEQETPSELAKMSQYSALETMKKLYFATKEYMEKWPSPDGYYTIHWSNTSDLSSYLYGEDCETENKRNFNSRKPRNQRKVYMDSEKEKIGLDILNVESKKEMESFNYIW